MKKGDISPLLAAMFFTVVVTVLSFFLTVEIVNSNREYEAEIVRLKDNLASARRELGVFKQQYGPVLDVLTSEDVQIIEQVKKDLIKKEDTSSQRVAVSAVLASEIHNVPLDMVLAVMHVESRFNPKAVSSARAKGLMQLTSLIWKHYTRYFPEDISLDVHDEVMNALVGTHYLADLSRKYKKDEAALLHYWGGPSATKGGGSYGRVVLRARDMVLDVMSWDKYGEEN